MSLNVPHQNVLQLWTECSLSTVYTKNFVALYLIHDSLDLPNADQH